jgi:Tfp pilus assembly protein PilO
MVVGIAAIAVLLSAGIGRYLVLPAYDQYKSLQATVDMQSVEHAKLSRNVSMGAQVDRQFEALGQDIMQSESDEVTLSQFLRQLESLARYPSMTLVNMKALPVRDEGAFKVFGVRAAVAGKLQEIVQFVSDLTSRPEAVGLEAFSIRGLQAGNRVECTLTVWMVRVAREGGGPKDDRLPQTVADSAPTGDGDAG